MPKTSTTSIQSDLFDNDKLKIIGKPNDNYIYHKFRKYLFEIDIDIFNKRFFKLTNLAKKIFKIDGKNNLILSDEGILNFYSTKNFSLSHIIFKIHKIFSYFDYRIKILIITRAPNSFIPSYYGTMGRVLKYKHQINFENFKKITSNKKNHILNKQFDLNEILSILFNYKYVTIIPYELLFENKNKFLEQINLFFDHRTFIKLKNNKNQTKYNLNMTLNKIFYKYLINFKHFFKINDINFYLSLTNFINLTFKIEFKRVNELKKFCLKNNMNEYYNSIKIKKFFNNSYQYLIEKYYK